MNRTRSVGWRMAVGMCAALISAGPTTGPTSGPAKPEKLKFAARDVVDVKWGGLWRKATVVNTRDGWYFVDYGDKPNPKSDFGKEWVEPARVRPVGSTEDDIGYAQPNPFKHGDGPPKRPPVLVENDAAKGGSDSPAEPTFPVTTVDRTGAATYDVTSGGGWSFTPVAEPPGKPLSPKTMPMAAKQAFFDDAAGMLFSSPQTPLLAVVRQGQANQGVFTYRLERFDLATGAALGVVPAPSGERPVALSPDGKSVLCVPAPHGWDMGKRIDWFTIESKELKHVLSWEPASPDADTFESAIKSATFVDAGHVFVVTGRSTGTTWAVDPAKPPKLVATIRSDVSTLFTKMVGRHLLVTATSRGRATFFEALTGRPVGSIDGSFITGDIEANDDGSKIAASAGGVVVYDGATGQQVEASPVEQEPFGKAVDFVDAGMVLFDHRLLVDPRRKLTLWKYQAPSDKPECVAVFGGRLYYMSPGGVFGKEQWYVASTAVPAPAVIEACKKVDTDPVYLMKPGTHVSIDVTGVQGSDEDRQTAEQGLRKAAAKSGLAVADNAPVTIKATMKPGADNTVTYHFTDGRADESLTVHPTDLGVDYVMGGQAISHQGMQVNGASYVVSVHKGETANDQYNKMKTDKPVLSFADFVLQTSVEKQVSHIAGTTVLGPEGLPPAKPAPGGPPPSRKRK